MVENNEFNIPRAPGTVEVVEPLDSMRRLSTQGEIIDEDKPLASGTEAYDKYGVHGNVLAEFEIGSASRSELDNLIQFQLLRSESGGYSLHYSEFRHYGDDGEIIETPDNAIATDHIHHILKIPDDGSVLSLGRNEETDQFIPGIEDNDLVSREHIQFAVGQHGVMVRDAESMNGVNIKTDSESSAEATEPDVDITVPRAVATETVTAPSPEAHKELVELAADNRTRELLEVQDGVLAPAAEVETSRGKRFQISSLYKRSQNSSRSRAIMYEEMEDGQLRATFLYKSNSDGGWRVSPGMRYDNTIMKGGGRHYTQETKLDPSILDALEGLEGEGGPVVSSDLSRQVNAIARDHAGDELQRFVAEVKQENLSQGLLRVVAEMQGLEKPDFKNFVDKRSPKGDVRTSDEDAMATIFMLNHAMKNTAGFVPNFKKQPIKTATREHTLLGETQFLTFEAEYNGRKTEWEIGDAGGGKVWVNTIRFADSDISSYGTDAEFIDSGIITSKPLEYDDQADGIPEEYKSPIEDSEYDDITPFLALLYPIERYKDAKRR